MRQRFSKRLQLRAKLPSLFLRQKKIRTVKNLRILLSGSSGFIGSEVFSFLRSQGHEVVRLRRGSLNSNDPGSLFWEPERNTFSHKSFENFDAVIHLAGEPLIGLWTAKKKERIFSSRILSTQLLTRIFTEIAHPPKVFVCASAIGFYGDRGEEELTEKSTMGKGFLPSVCSHWELATHEKANPRVRVVNTRFGAVIGREGGIVKKMLLPFKYGLGCSLGTGSQWMSWIALSDLVRAIAFCLTIPSIEGPVNCVAPHPVRQKRFAQLFADSLGRPLLLRLPAWLLRGLAGQMAEEVLLASQRVTPEKLQHHHFSFLTPTLEEAFRHDNHAPGKH